MATMYSEQAPVRLFTAGLELQEQWPAWCYQDLSGSFQGPFEPGTMLKWWQDGALPKELLCCGMHHLDKDNPTHDVSKYKPLEQLLADAEAGITYIPARIGSPNGIGKHVPAPTTRQQPASNAKHADAPHIQDTQQLRYNPPHIRYGSAESDVSRLDQGGLLQQATANTLGSITPAQPVKQQHPISQPSSQQPSSQASSQLSNLEPHSDSWRQAVTKLFNREGFKGKEADVKWRVILASGDRAGPFTAQQMLSWILSNESPQGVSKANANQVITDMLVCGIISADYNAQRLPGFKFYKSITSLLASTAANKLYDAVGKQELARGYPPPGWNDPPGGAAAPAPAGPMLQQQQQQQLPKSGHGPQAHTAPAAGPSSSGPSFGAGPRPTPAQRTSQANSQAAAAAAAAAAVTGLSGTTSSPSLSGPSSWGTGTSGAGSSLMQQPSSSSISSGGSFTSGLPQYHRSRQVSQAGSSSFSSSNHHLTPASAAQAILMAAGKAPNQPGGAAGAIPQALAQASGSGTGVYIGLQQQQQQQQAAAAGRMAGLPSMVAGSPQHLQHLQMQFGGLPGPAAAQMSGQRMGSRGRMSGARGGNHAARGGAFSQGVSGAMPGGLSGIDPQGFMLPGASMDSVGSPAAAAGAPNPFLAPAPAAGAHSRLHAAAMLFSGNQPAMELQPRWWVQRAERAYQGPMHAQLVLQQFAQGVLSETCQVCCVPPSAPGDPQVAAVPPPRAFAHLGAVLTAAEQGYVLLPYTIDSGSQAAGPLLLHTTTAVTVPLQQQLQQSRTSSGSDSSMLGSSSMQQGPGAHYNHSIRDSSVLFGLNPMHQAASPSGNAAAGLGNPDMLAMAAQIFTGGGLPLSMAPVWYVVTNPSADAQRIEGPLEPNEAVKAFTEGRLTASSWVCGVPRAQASSQGPPMGCQFQPLHWLIQGAVTAAAAAGQVAGRFMPATPGMAVVGSSLAGLHQGSGMGFLGAGMGQQFGPGAVNAMPGMPGATPVGLTQMSLAAGGMGGWPSLVAEHAGFAGMPGTPGSSTSSAADNWGSLALRNGGVVPASMMGGMPGVHMGYMGAVPPGARGPGGVMPSAMGVPDSGDSGQVSGRSSVEGSDFSKDTKPPGPGQQAGVSTVDGGERHTDGVEGAALHEQAHSTKSGAPDGGVSSLSTAMHTVSLDSTLGEPGSNTTVSTAL
eukprot:jgi/Chrzof1/9461/Cz04g03280.t1